MPRWPLDDFSIGSVLGGNGISSKKQACPSHVALIPASFSADAPRDAPKSGFLTGILRTLLAVVAELGEKPPEVMSLKTSPSPVGRKEGHGLRNRVAVSLPQ